MGQVLSIQWCEMRGVTANEQSQLWCALGYIQRCTCLGTQPWTTVLLYLKCLRKYIAFSIKQYARAWSWAEEAQRTLDSEM